MMAPDRIKWLLKKTQCIRTNAWEARFLSDLDDKLDQLGDDLVLTDKQAEKLEEIAAR
jgi:hypothetical protein